MFFTPNVLFTSDGHHLITGEDVSKLHAKFSPNKFDNNKSVYGDLAWWFKFLGTSLPSFENKMIRTSDLMRTNLKIRPPKNGRERNMITILKKMEDFYDISN